MAAGPTLRRHAARRDVTPAVCACASYRFDNVYTVMQHYSTSQPLYLHTTSERRLCDSESAPWSSSRIGAGRSGDGGARAGAIIAGCLGGGRTGVLGRAYSILGEVPPKAAPPKLADMKSCRRERVSVTRTPTQPDSVCSIKIAYLGNTKILHSSSCILPGAHM